MAPIAELLGPGGKVLFYSIFNGDVKVEQTEEEATITLNTKDGFDKISSLDPKQSNGLRLISDDNGIVFEGNYATRPDSPITIPAGIKRHLVPPVQRQTPTAILR